MRSEPEKYQVVICKHISNSKNLNNMCLVSCFCFAYKYLELSHIHKLLLFTIGDSGFPKKGMGLSQIARQNPYKENALPNVCESFRVKFLCNYAKKIIECLLLSCH